MDEKEAIALLKKDILNIVSIPANYLNDDILVKYFVKGKGFIAEVFEYIPIGCRTHKVCLEALKKDHSVMPYIPRQLRDLEMFKVLYKKEKDMLFLNS